MPCDDHIVTNYIIKKKKSSTFYRRKISLSSNKIVTVQSKSVRNYPPWLYENMQSYSFMHCDIITLSSPIWTVIFTLWFTIFLRNTLKFVIDTVVWSKGCHCVGNETMLIVEYVTYNIIARAFKNSVFLMFLWPKHTDLIGKIIKCLIYIKLINMSNLLTILPRRFNFVLFSFSRETTASQHAGSMTWPLCTQTCVGLDRVDKGFQCIMENQNKITSSCKIFPIYL